VANQFSDFEILVLPDAVGGTGPCTHNPIPISRLKQAPAAKPTKWINPIRAVEVEEIIKKPNKLIPAPPTRYPYTNRQKNKAKTIQDIPAITSTVLLKYMVFQI
jgi:hypothetical protein